MISEKPLARHLTNLCARRLLGAGCDKAMLERLYTTLNSPTQTFGDFMCTVGMLGGLLGVLCWRCLAPLPLT